MNEPYTDKELRRIRREDHRSPPTLRFLATIARLQARVEEAEEKARRYDSWFEPGRCPACHFTEKHMASCPVGIYKALAERRKKALEKIKTGRMDIGGKDEAILNE